MARTWHTFSFLSAATVGVAFLLGATSTGAQERFSNPEDAAKALVEAAKTGQPGFVDRIFGAGAKDLLSSRDPDEDRRRLADFNDAAADGMSLDPKGDDRRILRLGNKGWTFPIPIIKKGQTWAFDIQAGRDEILNRTIGFNELSATEACRAYVEAQKEYFREVVDADGIQKYAQRLISRPGFRDGLYWEPTSQSDRSPLDGRINNAVLERARTSATPEPYHGYRFRILKAQGPSAPGGAYNYVINGRMIAGFALVAFPAEWGKTGVMTFICNQQGKVYQKNLGAFTRRLGERMTRYDPDASWIVVD